MFTPSPERLPVLAANIARKFGGRYPPGVTHEDAVQDAALLLVEWSGKMPNEAHLFTKVYGTLRDRFGRAWRREYQHPTMSGCDLPEPRSQSEQASPGTGSVMVPIWDTAARLDSEQHSAVYDVREAVALLKGREKTVMLLILDGLTQAQVAERLKITQPYVSQIVKSARAKLRETLEDYE